MDLFIAVEDGDYFIAYIKEKMHSALYTRRNRKTGLGDLDRDPSSQLGINWSCSGVSRQIH